MKLAAILALAIVAVLDPEAPTRAQKLEDFVVGVLRREQRHECDQRDRRDVLEQQHGERRAADRRGEHVSLGHRLDRDCRGGKRERQPRDERGHPAEPRGGEPGGE